MSLPSVSVIMPSYNRADLIGESIESMLSQTVPPIELIVVDDGSTDETVSVIKSFGERVHLIQQANAGPGVARNTGLAAASGDFVQFFDSDDLATPNKLECQLTALAETGGDLAYGPWMQASLIDGEVRYDGMVRQQAPIGRSPLSTLMRGWLTLMQCCLVRRTLLMRVGGYPTDKRTGEDVELLFRLILDGAKLVYAPGGLVLYRQHPGGISVTEDGVRDRNIDRVRMTRSVWDTLSRSNAPTSYIDRLCWRAEIWEAEEQVRCIAGGAPELVGSLYSAFVRSRRIMAGARQRFYGSRYPVFFRPGKLDPGQHRNIGAIGYRPVAC